MTDTTVIASNDNISYVRVQCPFCGEEQLLIVPTEGFNAWKDGELIQRAMPNLSAEERELLISGMCGKCWKSMFGM